MSELMTADQVKTLIGEAFKEAALGLKAANTPDPAGLPAPASPVPMINLRRPQRPSISRAVRAISRGNWRGAELERDLSQATTALIPWNGAPEDNDPDAARSDGFTLPTTKEAYLHVLEETGIRTPASELGKYAIKALVEGTSALTSVTGAGPLVPIQFLTDEFVLALTSSVVLRQMPEVTVIPVTRQVIELPRESVAGAAATYAEAGAITGTDPTFAMQEFVIKKQAHLITLANELLNDSTPAIDGIINKMLARDLGLIQDYEYLDGVGTTSHCKGISHYTGSTIGLGLSTSSWTAATNGSTPGADDIIGMIFDIYTANATPTALVMHPRTFAKIVKLKDASGRYIFTSYATWGGPRMQSVAGTTGLFPSKAVGDLNGIPVYLSTQINITETQGSSSAASHIIYGDFNRCFILERQAVDIFLSEHFAMNNDQTVIRVTGRSTVALTQPLAFAVASGII